METDQFVSSKALNLVENNNYQYLDTVLDSNYQIHQENALLKREMQQLQQ